MEDEDEEEGVKASLLPRFYKEVWLDGQNKFHRLNGPAIIFEDGSKSWLRHGKLHCDDGPARILKDYEEWWKDGEPYEPTAHEIMVWKMKKKL